MKIDEALKTAVNRRIPRNKEKVGIGLSGGLDSRIILHHLINSEKGKQTKFFSFNYGINENNMDSILSKKLADLYNLDHQFVHIDYKKMLEKGLTYSEAELGGLGFRCIPFYEEIRKRGIKTVFLGEFGDCSFGKDIKKDYLNIRNEESFAEELFNDWNRIIPYGEQNSFFQHHMHPYIELSKKTILNLIKEHPNKNFGNTFNALNILEFERRRCAANSIAGKDFVQVISPFLDYDFQDFIYKLPIGLKLNERAAKEYVKKLNLISKIPRNTLEFFGNESLNARIWCYLLRIRHYLSRLFTKKIRIEAVKPIQLKGIDGKKLLSINWDFITEILNNKNALWKNFFEPKTIKKILEKKPQKMTSWEVYFIDKLVSFELWLNDIRKYLDDFSI